MTLHSLPRTGQMPERPGLPERTGRRRVRPAQRPAPGLSEDHEHLSLSALRSYREVLQAEEGRVSYWRRIIQARLDVVRDGRTAGGTAGLSAGHLRPVLHDSKVRAGRTALVQILPVDDIPPLPNLAELWERQVEPADPAALAVLESDLATAEAQLSDYRNALHQRLEHATDELIARYRVEPVLCLAVLPLRRPPVQRPGS